MECDFNLSDYIRECLIESVNDANYNVLNHIRTDIANVKIDISNKLKCYGFSNDNDLQNQYIKCTQLIQQIKGIESEVNAFVDGDLIERLRRMSIVCDSQVNGAEKYHKLDMIKKCLENIRIEIESIDEEIEEKLYDNSVIHINNARSLLDHLIKDTKFLNDDSEFIKIVDDMRVDITVKRQQIIYTLRDIFQMNFVIEKNNDKNDDSVKFIFLNNMKIEEFDRLINAVIDIEECDSLLKWLISSFNTYFVNPLFNGKIFHISLINDFTIIVKSKGNLSLIDNLKSFLSYFTQIFNSPKFLSRLGQQWYNDIFNNLITFYIKPSLPKNHSEIELYKSKINDAEDMRNFMIAKGFLTESVSSPFIEFIANINVDFATRMCHDYIFRAKKIICYDIHDTIEIGSEHSDSNDDVLQFPKCRISASIVDLINLIEDILTEASQCSNQNALILYSTVINICEMYIDISPVKHKSIISKLPQQNAIYHNNCMFLSHSLHDLSSRFQLSSKINNSIIEFIDILRHLGNDIFSKHLQIQEKMVLGFLQDPSVVQYLTENANGDAASKENQFESAIKKCIFHLKFLRSAFTDVLPQQILDKAIGILVNTMVSEITHRIVSLDDISADAAIQFTRNFEFAFQEIPKLFYTKSIFFHVKKWNKFKELKFILNAGLIDIVDRWAEGKGPLEAEYSAEEVKRMIRALFQNTDRRAAALYKIKSKV